MRRRGRGIVLRSLTAAIVLPVAMGQTAEAQPLGGDTIEVVDLRFTGVEAFDPAVLATRIVTSDTRCNTMLPLCWVGIGREPQYLDPIELARDSLRLWLLYYQEGYRSARITPEVRIEGAEARVTFHVEEGEPVRIVSLAFDGAAGLSSNVTRNLPLRVGAPFSRLSYEATRDSIATRLQNDGYPWGTVLANWTIPADSPLVAHVQYVLEPGPLARFDSIRVFGAQRVSESVVRRMLTFQPGDRYSLEDLLRSQRNLFSQEIFRHAQIQRTPEQPNDSTVLVDVSVNEGNLHGVRAGLGLSSADYLNVEGSWVSRSFFGGARRLSLRGRVSNVLAESLDGAPVFEDVSGIYSDLTGLISADFTHPWFFGPLNTFNAGAFAERHSLPQVFVRSVVGGSFTFGRTLGVNASIEVGYRPQLTRLETEGGDLIFCIGFVACGAEEIDAIRGPSWLAPATLSFAWDRSNSLFAPSRGFVVRAESELAREVTGSDFSYARLAGELIDYSTLTTGYILATRVRPGIAWPMEQGDSAPGIHPTRRFFAGGANSVRGYSQYRLGPKLLTADAVRQLALPVDSGGAGCSAQQINGGTCDASPIAIRDPGAFRVQPVGGAAVLEGNIELRFPIWGNSLRGVVFSDFGQVWPDRDDFRLSDIVWTPGLGVRYFSPIGPIRIDFGYNTAGSENVTVVTSGVEHCPPETAPACETIQDGVMYDHRFLRATGVLRAQPLVAWNPRTSFWRRLQLHFSIGQAF